MSRKIDKDERAFMKMSGILYIVLCIILVAMPFYFVNTDHDKFDAVEISTKSNYVCANHSAFS